jgi:hypothetical protein
LLSEALFLVKVRLQDQRFSKSRFLFVSVCSDVEQELLYAGNGGDEVKESLECKVRTEKLFIGIRGEEIEGSNKESVETK